MIIAFILAQAILHPAKVPAYNTIDLPVCDTRHLNWVVFDLDAVAFKQCNMSSWNTVNLGGGGVTPTGTGFVHVTGGVQDSAAKLIDVGDINNDQITFAKIQNITASRLLGRDSSGGDVQEITLGTNLSLSGTTLNAAGGGGINIVRKSADQASTSTTFANVTDLSFSVNASTVYSFECSLSYITAVSTTALQVSFNGPAAPAALRFTVETSTTATARHNASQNAYDAVTNPATGGAATALPVRLAGTLTNGLNAGTLSLRMRTEVNASSVTIQRGSFCILY